MDITTAIRLLAGRAPSVAHEALKTLRAPERTRQARYNWLVQQALRDSEADWSPQERADLVALVEPTGSPERPSVLSVRLTADERADLEAAAEAAGVSVSEYVRRRALDD